MNHKYSTNHEKYVTLSEKIHALNVQCILNLPNRSSASQKFAIKFLVKMIIFKNSKRHTYLTNISCRKDKTCANNFLCHLILCKELKYETQFLFRTPLAVKSAILFFTEFNFSSLISKKECQEFNHRTLQF